MSKEQRTQLSGEKAVLQKVSPILWRKVDKRLDLEKLTEVN